MDGNITPKNPFGKSPMSEIYGYQGGDPDKKKEKPYPPYVMPSIDDPDNKPKNFLKAFAVFMWEVLKIVLVAALIIVPVRYFLFQPFIVKGESMVPNLQSGDYLIVDEISYRFGSPQRGDIVVFEYPLDNSQRFIKRIIGLPGETVKINNGAIDITKDGKDIGFEEKKYLPDLKSTNGSVTLTLPPNNYFVLGDNRDFSYDSRRWGVLPREDIIGKAVFRLLPLENISYIPRPSYE